MYKPMKRAFLWKSGLDIIDIFMLLEDCLSKREDVWLDTGYKFCKNDFNSLLQHDIECVLEEIQLRRKERKNV